MHPLIVQEQQPNHTTAVRRRERRGRRGRPSPSIIWPPKDTLDRFVDSQNRLVVTFVNCGYCQFADNWANRLDTLGVTNYILVPLDESAHRLLMNTSFAPHVLDVPPFLLQNNNANGAADFGTAAFRTLTMTRPRILRAILEQNVTIFYNDVDSVWCQNVWEEYFYQQEQNQNDFSFAYAMDGAGGTTEKCTCLLYLTPDPKVFEVLSQWERTCSRLHGDGQHDQTAFNVIMRRFKGFPNISTHILDRKGFPAGRIVDWNKTEDVLLGPASKNNRLMMLHVNFMHFAQKQRSLENKGMWNITGQITTATLQQECNNNKTK
mmetsp:Transcript_4793/g.7483  ORF Transcript_4793/g.7483 Transcript_4793/m.7483 type:complete len:320 (-) Transcript_4793:24-983(-)